MATEASMRHALKVLENICEDVVKQIVTEKGMSYISNEAKNRLEYILNDTGIKNALICRAKTVDYALKGRTESAEKNYDYMTRIDTVEKLESDLLHMRTQLSLKGVDRKARVLASLFDVLPLNGSKTTSVVIMSDIAKEKFKNGTLRAADDCQLWTNIRSTEIAMELEETKRILAARQEDLIQTRKAYHDVLAYSEKLTVYNQSLEDKYAELNKNYSLLEQSLKQLQSIGNVKNMTENNTKIQQLEQQIKFHNKEIIEKDEQIQKERSDRVYIEAKYNALLSHFAHASNVNPQFDEVDGRFRVTIEWEASITNKILSMITGYNEIKRRYKHAKKLIKSMANMTRLVAEIPDDVIEKEVDAVSESSD